MRALWLLTVALCANSLLYSDVLPADYNTVILKHRQEEAQDLNSPNGWLSLVALTSLTEGIVSVGSGTGNTIHLEHGIPLAFVLQIASGSVTLHSVDSSVTIDGKHPRPGEILQTAEDEKSTLHWGDLWAQVIKRTGNQSYLRIGDPNSLNRRNFHGLHFYRFDPAYRITGKWVPYQPPREIHMGTILGTILISHAVGYAEFKVSGRIIRLDGEDTPEGQAFFSFRDGTARTTTYGAGRQVISERPSNGLKAPGTIIIDFNGAKNWPCAYMEYGTCPLPPKQNRFDVPIPAGEKRYH